MERDIPRNELTGQGGSAYSNSRGNIMPEGGEGMSAGEPVSNEAGVSPHENHDEITLDSVHQAEDSVRASAKGKGLTPEDREVLKALGIIAKALRGEDAVDSSSSEKPSEESTNLSGDSTRPVEDAPEEQSRAETSEVEEAVASGGGFVPPEEPSSPPSESSGLDRDDTGVEAGGGSGEPPEEPPAPPSETVRARRG